MANPIFDLLFPIKGGTLVTNKDVRHCLVNALHHMRQPDPMNEKWGYLSSVGVIRNGKLAIETNVVRTYTPSMEDGVIIPFDCKV